jgi:hypothetical protein
MAGIHITEAVLQAGVLRTALNVGAAAELRIYTGAAPTYTSDAATGTLLVSFTIGPFAAAFDDTPNGRTDANPAAPFPITQNAVATGTAGYFRVTADPGGGGERDIVQGTVGIASGDLAMNSLSITSGLPVIINSFSLIVPEEF